MLGVGVDLNFALVSIEQLQLLLQLHQQSFVLRFLGLIQSQLKQQKENSNQIWGIYSRGGANFDSELTEREKEKLKEGKRGKCTRKEKLLKC